MLLRPAPAKSLPVPSSSAPSRPACKRTCLPCSPTLAACQADISCANDTHQPVIRQTAGLMLSFGSLQSLGVQDNEIVSLGRCIMFNPVFTSLPVVRKLSSTLLLVIAMLLLMGPDGCLETILKTIFLFDPPRFHGNV